MMPFKFTTRENEIIIADLDQTIDIVEGPISHKLGWISLIVYEPKTKKFVELRDGPQDIKGNSKSECIEVTLDYIENEFSISKSMLIEFLKKPTEWVFIKR